MKKDLTAEDILKADDLKVEKVFIPEWDGFVYVRSLTGAERDAWEAEGYLSKNEKGQPNLYNLRARLVVLCAVDAEGNRLFTKEQAEALGEKNAGALDKIYERAQRLNALRDEDIEDLAGN